MKLNSKKTFLAIALLALSSNGVECLFIIPSMLMMTAMTGGLLMGKMTMGGLLMMLMAANQQQSGQNFLRNLGLVPHPSPSTGISVPGLGSEGLIQDLIVRKRRDLTNKPTVLNSKDLKPSQHGIVDEHTQYRIMRQVASTDPLGCLPQALCGMSAAPPSSQSGFLNDYAYLLKTVFTRDDDLDDDDLGKDLEADFAELMSKNKNKKDSSSKKQTTTPKPSSKDKKKETVQDDESSEEEVDGEEINSQRRKEAIEMEDMANEEILNNNPDYIPYAMHDSLKTTKHREPNSPYGPPTQPEDLPPPPEHPPLLGDIHQMSDAELDAVLSKLGDGPPPEIRRPGSILSNILPQLSYGFRAKGDNKFDDDPFFTGFKRSMESRRLEVDTASLRPATPEEEVLFEELRMKRRLRKKYIAQTRKELAEIKDPVEKFRIAAEFGQKLKSPRQCRMLFNNCPFSYNQVLGMVSDFRKAIMGEPLNAPQKDTVVDLKPANPNSAKNVINLNAGTSSAGGVTSIIHQLPTGEKVEINLKLTKGGLNTTRTIKPKPGTATNTTTSTVTNKEKKKLGENLDLFEDDENDNFDGNRSPVHSIENLKATIKAIQKINNVTTQRKKHRQPISYSHVLTDLDKIITASSYNNTAPEDAKLPEPDPLIVNKLQSQNNKPPRTPNNPQTTASLIALSLTKLEDDEADDTLPTSLLGIKRVTSTGPKSNQELSEILSRLKEVKSKKPYEHSGIDSDDAQADTSDDEDDDDGDDEEEDDINDMNKAYKSGIVREADERDHHHHRLTKRHHPLKPSRITGRIQQFFNRQWSPISRNSNLSQKNIRKPKKLFMGYDIDLPKPLPL